METDKRSKKLGVTLLFEITELLDKRIKESQVKFSEDLIRLFKKYEPLKLK